MIVLGFSQDVLLKENWHSLNTWTQQTSSVNDVRLAKRGIHLDDVDFRRNPWDNYKYYGIYVDIQAIHSSVV